MEGSKPMHIAVLGAGVVGLATAYYLVRDGHRVTLIEREAGVGLGTSFANGGQLSYSYVAPLAGPGVLPKIPPWLLRRDSPLRLHPRLDPQQWLWLAQFVRACSARQADLTTRRLLALSFYSRAMMAALTHAQPLNFDHTKRGKLIAYSDGASFDAARRLMAYQHSLGCEQEALSAAQCLELEPALVDLRARLSGGIFTPSEEAGDCYEFCLELERLLLAAGVKIALDSEIRGLTLRGGAVVAVETAQGPVACDAAVLTLGAASPGLMRKLGVRLPIYPLKGYSLTAPVPADGRVPRISVTDYKKRIVYALLGDELRVAGMADIAGFDTTPDPARLALLLREARRAFPAAAHWDNAKTWCGLRPATPKGPPILGPTGHAGLWLNVGHGALGFTLALGSGKVVADLIAGRSPAIGLDGLTLATM